MSYYICKYICFSADTKATQKLENGDIRSVDVENIRVGDAIETLNISNLAEKKFTKVLVANEFQGNFDFYKFQFENSGDVVEVTPKHLMICSYEKDGKVNDHRLKYAMDVKPDDKMLINGKASSISKIEKFQGLKKFDIKTESGTLLVGNVFVTGICDITDDMKTKINNESLVDFFENLNN